MNGNGLQSSSGSFSISSSEHEHSDLLNSSHSNLAMEDAEDNEEEGDTSSVTLPLEVEIQIKDTVSTSIYICEVCQKDKRDYNTLGDHRKHVHKLPWRQERLGPYGEISSYDLHPERQLVAKETCKLTYICEVCHKDCKNVQNLGSHRKKSHKLPYRQEWLGENGDISSYDLHPERRTFTSLATENSVYVCEVCNRDYKSYRNLGDHRRHQHKLPFRQEKLGFAMNIDSYELHPENKNRTVAPTTAESVYVCQVCNRDYKSYQNLKYHRKHTHKIAARQEFLGMKFDIPTDTLHPLPNSLKKDSPDPDLPVTVTPIDGLGPSGEWRMENGELIANDLVKPSKETSTEESIYVCEACKKVYQTYRQLGDHRRCAHKLPFRQATLGRNGELSSFEIHPENKSSAKTAKADSVYVCEVCKNDYRTYQNLKYHRKHTHKLQARQEMLGINGDIKTDELHPLKHCQKKKKVTSIFGGKFSVAVEPSVAKIKAQTIKTDSVYVCEVCKNDYKNYQNLKYHRKNTHGIAARQNRLGVNGEIDTDVLHPLKRFQKVGPNGKISVHPLFPKGESKKHYNYNRLYINFVKRLQSLEQLQEKDQDIVEEITYLQEIQTLGSIDSTFSDEFIHKLKIYRERFKRNGKKTEFIEADIDFLEYNMEDEEDPLQLSSVEITNTTENSEEMLFVKTEIEENEISGEIDIKEEIVDDVHMEIKEESEIYIKEEVEDY